MRISHPLSERWKLTFRFDGEPADTDELLEQFGTRWLKVPDDPLQLLSNLFRYFMKYGSWPAIEDVVRWFQGKRVSEVKELVERAVQMGFVQRDLEKNRYATCLWIGSDPTRHEVHVENGSTVYAGCALDALWVLSFTSENGIIRSACPHCEAKLSVWFEHGEIVKWEPPGIELFLGVKLAGKGTPAELGCPFINLFPGPEHIRAWLSKTPDVGGVPLTREETEKLAHVVKSGREQVTVELGNGLDPRHLTRRCSKAG